MNYVIYIRKTETTCLQKIANFTSNSSHQKINSKGNIEYAHSTS